MLGCLENAWQVPLSADLPFFPLGDQKSRWDRGPSNYRVSVSVRSARQSWQRRQLFWISAAMLLPSFRKASLDGTVWPKH